ncbi:MAG: ZPR1 zinc finger domain-containing protein [Thermofilaceae archaeon]|nr:ZPR1 zinc finger domain-containing protein [Thermofilaceae archaeon]MCX8180694.1 ZPR1 zinc finger domain-containing protein [Thermofilaceae archaeon]MDW8003798.1 ZPR1 zinc finger domain-containing protein [Thermofilaceae archaeon]
MCSSLGDGEVSLYASECNNFSIRCAFCGSEAVVQETVYELPKIGKALLVSVHCAGCGYRRREVVPIEVRKRKRTYYLVESGEDLNAKVIRGNAASIEIPELGISVTPGAAATLTVTNIEGLLRMFQDAAKSIEVLEKKETPFVNQLEDIIKNGGRFTLIIDDPLGISSIEPPSDRCKLKLLIEEVEGELSLS